MGVPRWMDLLSGWQSRHASLCIKLGNLESRFLAEKIAPIEIEKPIYIAGLARSGTTILLEILTRHPQLVSHRYRDFPPVLTPYIWNWFVNHAASNKQESPSERAHGDGLSVTSESPESFEEVIWMAFFKSLHDPDTSSVLTAESGDSNFEQFYREHIRKLLLLRHGNRYLSKANYNLTRLGYLLKLFPDAKFVLPVRDPIWHIASLLKQHRLFQHEHARDPRLKHHMSRCGHFEFGLDRQPVNSGNTSITRRVQALWSEGNEVAGWALYWQDVYGYVARLLDEDAAIRRATLLIDYEKLCTHPRQMMEQLISHCELSAAGAEQILEAADVIRHPSYYRPDFDTGQMETIEAVTGPVRDRLLSTTKG